MPRQQLLQTLFLIALSPTLALAQPATGSVSGHVYCADTQQPARVAHVVLVPLPPPGTPQRKPVQSSKQPSNADTRIDGSFTIAHVPPGNYYLSVTYSGYLSAEYQFSEDELLNPTQEIRKRIDELLPIVTVAAGQTSTTSAIIHRGAAISGTIRYDDGSPVPDIEVDPIVRGTNGKWKALPKSASDQRLLSDAGTDDQGHFRIRELPPGEYSLQLSCCAQGQGALTIYYGDSFFSRDAKTIKLGEGEDASGQDITIRLSKLHKISGALVNGSGQPINSAKIQLLTVPDGVAITSAEVNFDDSAFRMDLVPEGTYTARVTRAANVRYRIIPGANLEDFSDYKDIILQSYSDYEAPIQVLGDIPSLILTIPPKPAAKQSSPPSN